MSKKGLPTVNEFACTGCKELLPLGTKKCKWCGIYISDPPTTPVVEPPGKKSFFNRGAKKS